MNGLTEHKILFNNNSYLSVGIVVLIIGATLWLNNGLSRGSEAATEVKTELQHYKEVQKLQDEIINTKIDGLTVLLKTAGEDRFTGHDHKIFVERLQELNPGLKVPHQQ